MFNYQKYKFKKMRNKFLADLLKGKKSHCECCGRYARFYKRRIHAKTAEQLIKLYKLGGADKYIHVSNLLTKGDMGIGDFSKAKYWDLITPAPSDPDKKSKGEWMLTTRGKLFVQGKLTIQESVLLYNDGILGKEGDFIGITQCLMSGGFNYKELMN